MTGNSHFGGNAFIASSFSSNYENICTQMTNWIIETRA